MPVIDGEELFRLVLYSIPLGILLGLIHCLMMLPFVFVGKKGKKIRNILLIDIPRIFADLLFFAVAAFLNMCFFSAYGGGSVRMIALITEFTALTYEKKAEDLIIKRIRERKRSRIIKEKDSDTEIYEGQK